MAIQTLDNFWSSLLQGFQQGAPMGQENYWRQTQRADNERERRRQEAAQTFQLLAQLNQQGAAPASSINEFLKANKTQLPSGLDGINFAPSKAEVAGNIARKGPASAPVNIPGMGQMPSVPNFSREQYEFAGMTDPIERRRTDKLKETQQAVTEAQLTDLQNKVSPQNLAIENFNTRSKAFSTLASGAAQEAISRIGGYQALNSDQLKKLPKAAMAEIKARGILNQLGAVTPEQEAQLEGLISGNLNAAWMEWYQAQTPRITASLRISQGGRDPGDVAHDNVMKQFEGIKQLRAALRQEMGNFDQIITGPMFNQEMIDGMAKSMPEIKSKVVEWRQRWDALSEREKVLTETANRLFFGTATKDDILGLTGQGETSAAATGSINRPITTEMVDANDAQIEAFVARAKSFPRNQQQLFINNVPVLKDSDKAKILKRLGFDG